MATIGDAVQGLGYETTPAASVILARPDDKGRWRHAPLETVANRPLASHPTLYVATGRFRHNSVSLYRGRTAENLVDITDIPLDFDLSSFTGQHDEAIWAQPYDETLAALSALAEDVTEVLRACRIPFFCSLLTGYGLLYLVRVASPFRHDIAHIRGVHDHLVGTINRYAGMTLADPGVKDAGTRIIRVPGSLNQKASSLGIEDRPVSILEMREELFNPTAIKILRPIQREAIIPETKTLPPALRNELVQIMRSCWTEGYRHNVALGMAAMWMKAGIGFQDAMQIMMSGADGDDELRDRQRAVQTTYESGGVGRPISGYYTLKRSIPPPALDALDALLTEFAQSTSRVFQVTAAERQPEPEPIKPTIPDSLPKVLTSGWFGDYLSIVAPTTSAPDIYHLASILTVVGAMIGRRVGVFLGEPQYPILHTILVGETGSTKKDTAMNRAVGAMYDSGSQAWQNLFTLVRGVGSAEALSDVIANNTTLLQLSEFTAFLHKARQPTTANLLPMVTELWNCGGEYSLITRGNPVRIQNPTMALLGGIPPETLAHDMSAREVESGFANRLLLVFGKGKPILARPPQPDKAALGDLRRVMRDVILSYYPGTILEFSPDAGERFDAWFYAFSGASYLTEVERQIAQRVPSQVVRVACLYAVSEGNDAIALADIEAGIVFVEQAFQDARRHVVSWGANDEARLSESILAMLHIKEQPRAHIDAAFSPVFGPTTVSRTLEAMRANGRIAIDATGVVFREQGSAEGGE